MASNPLATTKYVRVGAYIGQILAPRTFRTDSVSRYPCFIGKGSRYAIISDEAIRRSYYSDRALVFPAVGTPVASIADYPSDGVQLSARLYTSDGDTVNPTKWAFGQSVPGGPWDEVQIDLATFNSQKTYYLSYQSTSRTIKDPVPFTGMRSVIRVGDAPGQNRYVERTHFKLTTAISTPEATEQVYDEPEEGHIDQSNLVATPISFASGSAYNHTYNRLYTFTINTGTQTIAWTAVTKGAPTATDPNTSGSGTYNPVLNTQNFTVEHGLVLDIDGTAIDTVNDDGKTFQATAWGASLLSIAGTAEYRGYDDRSYEVTITDVRFDGAKNVCDFTWASDTPEGGWGQGTADDNSTVELPDGVILNFYNLGRDLNPATPLNDGCQRHFATSGPGDPVSTVSDVWTFDASNEETIDWSLTATKTETFAAANIILDRFGKVTGTRLSYYLILTEVPQSITSVEDPNFPGVPLTYIHIANTNYIWFPSGQPAGDVVVVYTSRGLEPNPGDTYYISSQVLRPDTYYNKPIFIEGEDQGQAFLAPNIIDASGNRNELFLMTGEIAFRQATTLQGCYVIQVKDIDDDGIFQDPDYMDALSAAEKKTAITDVVILNRYSLQDDLMTSVIRCNDPFVAKERLAWIGLPIGTEVGDVDTPDTRVYLAKKSFQIFGDSPAHGSIVLHGNVWATHTTRLYDNTALELTLDGTYLAGAAAAHYCGFSDPGQTFLKQTLGGFNDIEDLDENDQDTIGAAGMIFLVKEGNVFRYLEDQTLDSLAPDTSQINAMGQKQYVTKTVRAAIDAGAIGAVPPSVQAGVDQIRAVVARTLITLAGRKIIGAWTESGTARSLNPDKDIEVYVDENDPMLYWVLYWFTIRYPIKRVFGLYSVDTRNWGEFTRSQAA